MATKHGNRVYIQVLLEPFRGELFMQEADAQGIKPSALIRQLVYDYLAENTKEEAYCQALVNDKQKWQDAVDARLEGRARNRRSKVNQSDETIDASSSPM
nr:hypothetical protein [uncultured Mediterranean phage uvMED]